MLQKITLAEVLAAGRKAYEEKRLQAQNGGESYCTYRDNKGCPCVVGAAMTVETLDSLRDNGRNKMGIGDLARREFVSIPEEDVAEITRLQAAHDQWSWAVADDPSEAAEAEESFRARLYGEK